MPAAGLFADSEAFNLKPCGSAAQQPMISSGLQRGHTPWSRLMVKGSDGLEAGSESTQ
jgi:hypothetical protein